MIHAIINAYRNRQARKRLAELVAQTASSEEITSYRVHRDAQKKSPHYQRAVLKRIELRQEREARHG